MSRQQGTFVMRGNAEPEIAAPFDARTVVETKADLTDASNFGYPYVGMIVSVKSEGKAYMLTALDTTVEANWKAVGDGAGVTVDDALSTTSTNPVQNKVITETLDGKQDVLTAGDNIDIVVDPYTGANVISASGGSGDGKMGSDFTTNIEVGGLPSGTAISKDDLIKDVLKNILTTTYYPTYVAPSASIVYNVSELVEIGTTFPVGPAQVLFDAGAIMLQGVKQNNRAGVAIQYSISTTGFNVNYNADNNDGNFSMPTLQRTNTGTARITGTVEHLAGPQPKDSDGNDYQSPLPAGTVTVTKNIEFIKPFYFGVSDSMTISDFTGFTKVLEKKGTKQYTYVTNNQHFVIAYDSSYGDLTSILDPNSFETKSSWTKSTLTVNGQQYNVYVAQSLTTNPGAKYTFKF